MEWEAWLEKGRLRNLITSPDIYSNEIAHVDGTYTREPPVSDEDIKTHHAEKEKPRMFPTIIREFVDDAEDKESKKSWEAWLEKDAMDGKQSGSPKEEPPKRDYLKEMIAEGDRNIAAGTNAPKHLAFLKQQEKTPKRIKRITDANKLPENNAKKLEINTANPKHYMGKKPKDGELESLLDLVQELGKKKSWESWLEKTEKEDKLGKEAINSSKELGDMLNNTMEHGTKEEKYIMGDSLEDMMETAPIPRGIEAVHSGHHDTRFKHRKSRNAIGTKTDSRMVPPPRISTSGYNERIEPDKKRSWTHTIANENKSWEDWLEKNNAIETSHKDEKEKHEWDGKFSSSTIRDDAKDDKAMDEESDEIMEDAGLEEIEKLKSWESWLEKNEKWDKDEKEHDKEHIKQRKGKKDAIADMKALHRHFSEERKRGENTEFDEIMGDVKNPILHETQDEPRPTPSIMPKNLTPKKPRYVKGVEQKGDVADERDSLNIQIADSMKSWKSWLDKMQGAGDARFGNQHLTGLDQKPVNNEEDEANILPEKEEKLNEKEENNEKEDKKEDKEEEDNKPYKALR